VLPDCASPETGVQTDDKILFRNGDLTLAWAGRWRPLRAGAERGGLGGPRADVDALWRLCCGDVVGEAFADGLQSVFQPSLSWLVRCDATWGCCDRRAEVWASSGRGPLQQACWFTAVYQCRNVHCELPQCIASVCMWAVGCNLGLPSSSFALPSSLSRPDLLHHRGGRRGWCEEWARER
jgi:hypothetical protein